MPHAYFKFADITIDLMTGKAYRQSLVINCHPMELRMLIYLASKAPLPVSRRELRERVWGLRHELDDELNNNTIQVHVSRLRSHLNEPIRREWARYRPHERQPDSPVIIQTWGPGYRILPEVKFFCGQD